MNTDILKITKESIKKLKAKEFRLQAETDGASEIEYNKIIDELRETRQELARLNYYYTNAIKKLSRNVYVENCIYLHYEKGYSWKNIAMSIGGNNTGDGIRMMCKRYEW